MASSDQFGERATIAVVYASADADGDRCEVVTYGSNEANGFIGSALDAYDNHGGWHVRPDDFWLAIGMAFSTFLEYHHEEVRDVLVDFDAKQEIVIELDTNKNNPARSDYALLVAQFADKLVEKIKCPDFLKAIVCDFSTTTPLDATISKLVGMSALKSFFEYRGHTLCGFDRVFLHGTSADWNRIVDKVELLQTLFDGHKVLRTWLALVHHVALRFLDAYNGDVNVEFWNHVAGHESRMSGTPYVSGWLLVFTPFRSRDGKFLLSGGVGALKTHEYGHVLLKEMPHSAVSCPITLDDTLGPSGRIYKVLACAGFYVYETDTLENSTTLFTRPRVDMVVFNVTGNDDDDDTRAE